jgi:tRNA (guanine10-N2)-methyltransferase
MDHELSFVMCNLALVRKGSLVYDPFVGTGSILVSAAAWGAHVLGTDIDIRVIRDGKRDKHGHHCNVYSNFRDYGLQDPVGLYRADMAHPPWRPGMEGIVDVILCDPPYGVRAGGKKIVPRDPAAGPVDMRCAQCRN